ncbi:hypothetical protein BKA65DRAFT_557949 [Rhexocercosporidium sp. MPI-PUGE-AT-0058]|nr:hypothetical protein BKA65DRAFT_557949 [Rhexocercosporidium sp. MPI-PUGE-AT-0058]
MKFMPALRLVSLTGAAGEVNIIGELSGGLEVTFFAHGAESWRWSYHGSNDDRTGNLKDKNRWRNRLVWRTQAWEPDEELTALWNEARPGVGNEALLVESKSDLQSSECDKGDVSAVSADINSPGESISIKAVREPAMFGPQISVVSTAVCIS